MAKLSPVLEKALGDPFWYACGLRTGQWIQFHKASLGPKGWIHLELDPDLNYDDRITSHLGKERELLPGDRGISVRLADIVWVMDAPVGS